MRATHVKPWKQVALEFPDFQFGIGNAEDFKDLLDDSLGGKPGKDSDKENKYLMK